MSKTFDSASFRQVLGSFATGIAVVTAKNGHLGAFGLTINSLTSVSLDPPLVLFCLDKAAHLYDAFKGSEHFGINLLADDQEAVSRHFADRHNATPDNLWDVPREDGPVLQGSLGWIMCKAYAQYDGGDHTIFVGEATELYKQPTDKNPLLYFRGRYREIAEVGVPSGSVTSGARK